MLVFLRIISVLLWIAGVFLIAVVINAATSGGVQIPGAIGYVVVALVLLAVSVWLWRVPRKPEPPSA
jgi:uncharacterized membrane protein